MARPLKLFEALGINCVNKSFKPHPPGWKHKYRSHWKHGSRWGLRRRLTLVFTFVALAAVFLTAWFILGSVYSAFFPDSHMTWKIWKHSMGSDASSAQAQFLFRRIVGTAFFAGTLSFVLASIVAGIVTRILTRPLIALTDGAKRLALGERGLRLNIIHSRDELQSLTEAFNSLVAGLEQQEAWRRNMVADIAHDLRTPMSVLRSEIEAMQDGVSKPDGAGLERLHHQVMLLNRLIEDLRTLSLAESGGLVLHKEALELEPFLRRVVGGFTAQAQQAQTQINLFAEANYKITIDPKQMTRVLNNLLDNALRYGQGPIEVKVHKQMDTLTIGIRDHGPGIAEKALERIFERFYKEDSSRTRTTYSGGSGLGLSIAKAIIEAHAGRLEASNHPQGGAVFEIYLPIQT